jgi:hypothetical protein
VKAVQNCSTQEACGFIHLLAYPTLSGTMH